MSPGMSPGHISPCLSPTGSEMGFHDLLVGLPSPSDVTRVANWTNDNQGHFRHDELDAILVQPSQTSAPASTAATACCSPIHGPSDGFSHVRENALATERDLDRSGLGRAPPICSPREEAVQLPVVPIEPVACAIALAPAALKPVNFSTG